MHSTCQSSVDCMDDDVMAQMMITTPGVNRSLFFLVLAAVLICWSAGVLSSLRTLGAAVAAAAVLAQLVKAEAGDAADEQVCPTFAPP